MVQQVTSVVDDAAVQDLKTRVRGELIRPGDAQYDEARKVYNGMIDKRPALIARCVDVADVISAVNFAREHGTDAGGARRRTQRAGLGTCDDGLVIDLSRMKGIRVDPAESHGARRGRLRLGRCRPCDAPLRAGDAERLHLDAPASAA